MKIDHTDCVRRALANAPRFRRWSAFTPEERAALALALEAGAHEGLITDEIAARLRAELAKEDRR